ncbi:uncharacterized protein FOMMEDRAFT_19022 [Fomitiporia mediterranea MF3/22]|uniref:uncharacterized protein n=1 Tax=Fomitiporia mediterranea (strain MF3/22) TaxID=694068 RepID=UPI00044086E4|nr:uncharacterized protein FOMMEDRAFT_19022 [Fomitiporia mediterranea MF3/22]EJD03625.1 hypothetical protein FOMMEDRAFT_19022 [Fomitiporia mediterranea MF3/22]
MDASHLPGYFSISLVMEERRLPNNFPDGHIHGYRHHPPTNSAQNNVNVPVSNDGDQCLEDAQLILGRDVTFVRSGVVCLCAWLIST